MVVNKLWTKNRNFAILAVGQKISGNKNRDFLCCYVGNVVLCCCYETQS